MGGSAGIMKKKKIYINVLKHLILIALAVVVLIPVYYLIVTTFKSGAEAAMNPMGLPSSIDFSGYIKAFQDMQYPRAFKNTLIITACSVVGIIFKMCIRDSLWTAASRSQEMNLKSSDPLIGIWHTGEAVLAG